ncbi:MAG: TlpA disulfide reductase family protein [Ferruginibacter sp.]
MNQQMNTLFLLRNFGMMPFLRFSLLALCLYPLSGKGQPLPKVFYLNGSAITEKQDKVYLSYYSNTLQKGINDSCKIIDGHFFFKGLTNDPAVAFVRLSRDRVVDDQTAIIFIEPVKMEIKLTSSPFEVVMSSGSKTQLEYDSLNEKKKLLREKYKQIITEFEKGNKDRPEIKMEPFYEELRQLDYTFFASHPHSFATGYMLQFYYRQLSADALRKYYYNMDNTLRTSIYGIRLKDLIPKIKLTLPGKRAPEFTSTTYKNEPTSLSNFQGQYVLLDFWADWCVPCRQNFPHLLKLYAKYHNKGLEIIGVADNDFQQVAWKRAIENDKIGIWHNVLRGLQKSEMEAIDKTNSINDKYNVSLLPTKVLIDPSGIIIGRYEGTEGDEQLELKLKEIFE